MDGKQSRPSGLDARNDTSTTRCMTCAACTGPLATHVQMNSNVF
jgi:hypothetical protein